MLNTLFCRLNQCCLHLKFVYPDVTYIVLLRWTHLLNSAYSVDLHLAAPDVRLFLQVHQGGESRHGLGDTATCGDVERDMDETINQI